MLLSWLGRMQLNPGMLRTGCRELHQELHIDEADLIDKEDEQEILEEVMRGNGDLRMRVMLWLRAGYVEVPATLGVNWRELPKTCYLAVCFDCFS